MSEPKTYNERTLQELAADPYKCTSNVGQSIARDLMAANARVSWLESDLLGKTRLVHSLMNEGVQCSNELTAAIARAGASHEAFLGMERAFNEASSQRDAAVRELEAAKRIICNVRVFHADWEAGEDYWPDDLEAVLSSPAVAREGGEVEP